MCALWTAGAKRDYNRKKKKQKQRAAATAGFFFVSSSIVSFLSLLGKPHLFFPPPSHTHITNVVQKPGSKNIFHLRSNNNNIQYNNAGARENRSRQPTLRLKKKRTPPTTNYNLQTLKLSTVIISHCYTLFFLL